MYRGTTPTYTFTLPDEVDLTLAADVYVTFAKYNRETLFTKTGSDLSITAHSASVYLTQEETLSLPGEVLIQLNWTYAEGTKMKRACSDILTIRTKRNLINEVIEASVDTRTSDLVGTGAADYMTINRG